MKKPNEQPIDMTTLIGKRILFCIKRDTIENSIPENAFEGDVIRIEGGYVNMNCTMNNGAVVNEWKALNGLRIITVVGDALETSQLAYTPAQEMILDSSSLEEVIRVGLDPHLSEGPEEKMSPGADSKFRVFPLPDHAESPSLLLARQGERIDEMRHELTAVRHMVGTWCDHSEDKVMTDNKGVENDLYLESHDYILRSVAQENVRLNKLLDEQAKEIGMMKRVLTTKGLIA